MIAMSFQKSNDTIMLLDVMSLIVQNMSSSQPNDFVLKNSCENCFSVKILREILKFISKSCFNAGCINLTCIQFVGNAKSMS